MSIESVLSTLFVTLLCFVFINTGLSLFLWRNNRHPIYQKMLQFWFSNILYLGVQFFFPETKYEIVLAYGVGVLPMTLVYGIVCKVLKTKPNIKRFILSGLIAFILTLAFLKLELSFTICAMPFSIALALPLISAIKLIFVDHKKTTTLLQKALGFILVIWVIQCFNFAFFRMAPNAQLYGWVAVYALYDVLAILLPAISIEKQQLTERVRLQKLVTERTSDLSKVLNDKENLLRILIHDISTPLTVMRWYLTSLKNNPTEKLEKHFEKIQKSQETVENIVNKVKELQIQSNAKLSPISVSKCIDELVFLFEQSLAYKHLKLEIKDNTTDKDLILADQFTLTHNILSNLISNAIKFSFPHDTITLEISRNEDSLMVSIKDQGVGMTKETIEKIIDKSPMQSTLGTHGEYGTGYGLGIVNTMLETIRGCLKIESTLKQDGIKNHGTTVTITFPLV